MNKSADRGHAFIAKEIAKRDSSVMSEWTGLGINEVFAQKSLRCIQESLGYSNWYFRPSDNLGDVVDDVSYDFSSCELLQDIREVLRIDLHPCEELRDKSATIGLLVEHIWAKTKESEGDTYKLS